MSQISNYMPNTFAGYARPLKGWMFTALAHECAVIKIYISFQSVLFIHMRPILNSKNALTNKNTEKLVED